MSTENQIQRYLDDLDRFGWACGLRADVLEKIALVAAEGYAEEMESMGNDPGESARSLARQIRHNAS